MRHFFNVFMWTILIAVPLFLFMAAAGLALVMEHFYWRYYDLISRIFPRKVA